MPSFVLPSSPDLHFELAAGRAEGRLVAGVDEVGRGPLAGPVVACAVILPAHLEALPTGVQDSKALRPAKRDALAVALRETVLFGLGEASVDEIDQLNILQATFLAMRRALAALSVPHVDHALIDGPHIPKGLPCGATAVVKGDARSLSIAAASIIAKSYRDQLMQTLASDYPAYGWASNAGYGSAAHMAALKEFGPTPHHRRSFAPVAALLAA